MQCPAKFVAGPRPWLRPQLRAVPMPRPRAKPWRRRKTGRRAEASVWRELLQSLHGGGYTTQISTLVSSPGGAMPKVQAGVKGRVSGRTPP